MPEVAANSARDVFIDTRTLMQIRSLELRARIVVQGFWNGIHRSPYHGFSVEFTEYRQYVPGDDPRYVDWRVYARSDRYFIKKFEDETNRRCYLVVDQSRSMSYGSSRVCALRVRRSRTSGLRGSVLWSSRNRASCIDRAKSASTRTGIAAATTEGWR